LIAFSGFEQGINFAEIKDGKLTQKDNRYLTASKYIYSLSCIQ